MDQIFKAIRKNSCDNLEKLILGVENGKELNTLSDCKELRKASALHLACFYGFKDIANLLLQLDGIDPNIPQGGSDGYTPIFYAVQGGHSTVDLTILLLRHKDCDVNARDIHGNTPAHIAASENNETQLGCLLSHGADIDALNHNLETPLHAALYARGHEASVLLINKGANLWIRDCHKKLPLHLSVQQDLLTVTAILIKHVSPAFLADDLRDLNVEDEEGNTPLHLAAQKANLRPHYNLLREYGLKMDSANSAGMTPEAFLALEAKHEQDIALERKRRHEHQETRKREMLMKEINSTEIYKFCERYGIDVSFAISLYNRGHHMVDKAFLNLTDTALNKLGIEKGLIEKYNEARTALVKDVISEDALARAVMEAYHRKILYRTVLSIFLVLVIVFASIYLYFKISLFA